MPSRGCEGHQHSGQRSSRAGMARRRKPRARQNGQGLTHCSDTFMAESTELYSWSILAILGSRVGKVECPTVL